jgi:uncharacterized protein with HEPN domain
VSQPGPGWIEHLYGIRTERTLDDVLEFAGMAERLVARGIAAYQADEAIRLAAEAVLHRLGEAVARLPDAFIEQFPALRLKAFKGMRNLVAHRYHDVDYQILWSTLVVDIPQLATQIKELLDKRLE